MYEAVEFTSKRILTSHGNSFRPGSLGVIILAGCNTVNLADRLRNINGVTAYGFNRMVDMDSMVDRIVELLNEILANKSTYSQALTNMTNLPYPNNNTIKNNLIVKSAREAFKVYGATGNSFKDLDSSAWTIRRIIDINSSIQLNNIMNKPNRTPQDEADAHKLIRSFYP